MKAYGKTQINYVLVKKSFTFANEHSFVLLSL